MNNKHKIYSVVCILLLLFMNLNAQEVTIGFVGDVMLGRTVSELLKQKKDYLYPWGNLLPILTNTDFNVANLETTLTKSGMKVPKVFNFKSAPSNAEALIEGNFKVVNLANNHSLDYGKQGLVDTLKTLDSVGIKHMGAGLNAQQAQQPALIQVKGLTFGFLGYTDNEPGWIARENKEGVQYIAINDASFNLIKNHIIELRKKVDFLIVSLHWGSNWEEKPSREFQKFAHQLIDAGVDIIHGHSSHIVQGVEIYNNKLIMYSTGDFLDDYAIDNLLRNDQSFLFLVTLDKNGLKKLRLIPAVIKNMQVTVASRSEAYTMLQRIQKLSFELGTFIPNNGIIRILPQKLP